MAIEWDLISAASSSMTAVGETTALIVDHEDIYCTFVDSQQNAVIAKKSIGLWEYNIVGTNVLNDAHNGSSSGIDPEGYIYVVWDIHGRPTLNLKKSQNPYSISVMIDSLIGGIQPANVSYARFYRAGSELYFMCRVGISGNGDEWIKRWTSSGWIDLATPLISGTTINPTDNPYIGSSIGTPDGCLHIIWTHRIGLHNFGVYYARYNPTTGLWTKADGSTYTLPITRLTSVSIVDPTDGTISNNGLGLVIDSQSRPNIVFSKHVNGSPEVFYARYEGGNWSIKQLSNIHLPRLRSCPTGPQDGPMRPCDVELQGPFISKMANGCLRVLYLRSVSKGGVAWQRPPAILYETISINGYYWSTREIKRNVNSYIGELIRESNGLPMFMVQENVQPSGNLWLWTPEELNISNPIADVSVSLPCASSQYLELDSSAIWSSPTWTISAWVRPEEMKSTMGIIDKGGVLGSREFRLLLWGYGPPFVYNQNRIQVLIGTGSSWGLLWYPEIEVLPGLITYLGLVWNGSELRLYKNGILAAQVTTNVIINHSDLSRVLIGANRDASGVPERFFSGDLTVSFYPVALGDAEIKFLYDAGFN